jgi:hypothetical protein
MLVQPFQAGPGGGPKCSLFISKVPQGVQQPRPMPNAMGPGPIADSARATRCTPDGHREHATSPTKKNTHPTHLRASLPFSSSRSLDSDESADGQPSTQHEIHKAHQTARVCIQALRVIYLTFSSPGFAPCSANVSTSPPSCTPRGKSSVDGHGSI